MFRNLREGVKFGLVMLCGAWVAAIVAPFFIPARYRELDAVYIGSVLAGAFLGALAYKLVPNEKRPPA